MSRPRVEIRERDRADTEPVRAFLAGHGADRVARRGELVEALDHPALLAERGEELVGALTWIEGTEEVEILTLHAALGERGVASALLAALRDRLAAGGPRPLFVVTTNDNLDALGFYQRRGFRLRALRTGAVTESRMNLKPEIPIEGAYRIEIRDELELELR